MSDGVCVGGCCFFFADCIVTLGAPTWECLCVGTHTKLAGDF